jgi:hypothetical protein
VPQAGPLAFGLRLCSVGVSSGRWQPEPRCHQSPAGRTWQAEDQDANLTRTPSRSHGWTRSRPCHTQRPSSVGLSVGSARAARSPVKGTGIGAGGSSLVVSSVGLQCHVTPLNERAILASVQLVDACGGWFGIRLRLLMAWDRWQTRSALGKSRQEDQRQSPATHQHPHANCLPYCTA